MPGAGLSPVQRYCKAKKFIAEGSCRPGLPGVLHPAGKHLPRQVNCSAPGILKFPISSLYPYTKAFA